MSSLLENEADELTLSVAQERLRMRRSEDVSSPSSFLSATLKPACLTPRWASSYLDISDGACVPSGQGEKEKAMEYTNQDSNGALRASCEATEVVSC